MNTMKIKNPGKKWAEQVISSHILTAVETDALVMAAGCLNRINAARKEIDKEGITVLDRYQVPKVHPAVVIEKEQKALFIQICKSIKILSDGKTDNVPDPLQLHSIT